MNRNPGTPTAVELINFTAQSDASGKVYLQWQTGYEVNNLGFNLYRDAGGNREHINPLAPSPVRLCRRRKHNVGCRAVLCLGRSASEAGKTSVCITGSKT